MCLYSHRIPNLRPPGYPCPRWPSPTPWPSTRTVALMYTVRWLPVLRLPLSLLPALLLPGHPHPPSRRSLPDLSICLIYRRRRNVKLCSSPSRSRSRNPPPPSLCSAVRALVLRFVLSLVPSAPSSLPPPLSRVSPPILQVTCAPICTTVISSIIVVVLVRLAASHCTNSASHFRPSHRITLSRNPRGPLPACSHRRLRPRCLLAAAHCIPRAPRPHLHRYPHGFLLAPSRHANTILDMRAGALDEVSLWRSAVGARARRAIAGVWTAAGWIGASDGDGLGQSSLGMCDVWWIVGRECGARARCGFPVDARRTFLAPPPPRMMLSMVMVLSSMVRAPGCPLVRRGVHDGILGSSHV
ncbi:hypothetical protein BD413DRAFT_210006 [Trametes elegans]|nr:hypothetical protein BD413DRAFT_210006 [Trametes elegans]